jgi:hypothetical protein
MPLSDSVFVERRFQRAIRIDAGLGDPRALDGYICPKSSADVLTNMAEHVRAGQGAFTWTGPYGSGKSSLAVALSALLQGTVSQRAKASDVLGRKLAKHVTEALPPKSKGWRVVPVIGRREHPARVIGEALTAFGIVGRRSSDWTDTRVLEALETATAADSRTSGGILVFIDEMGKLLEAATQEGVDIYFFQQLAELASRSKGRLIVVGILHQAFDEYASRLAREIRDEWSKVQGRFVDLIVNAAGEEQLELLGRAIVSSKKRKQPLPSTVVVADVIRIGRPGAAAKLADLLEKCWPLHPVVAALLGPLSRRRFGQNQRSLFGFLNSAEPHGFQDFLRDAKETDVYRPAKLWDYLRVNLEPTILASPDGHRWSMAVEAVERCEAIGGGRTHEILLKTIALLDLFRERSGLVASESLLVAACDDHASSAEIQKAIEDLKRWSFVIFRKHTNAFAIYAGSDFDLEQALTESLSQVREVNFKDLRAFAGLQPVLAKRHYHDTGALRWFDIDLLSVADLEQAARSELPGNGAMGRFVLAIPTKFEKPAAARKASQSAANLATHDLIVGLSNHAWRVTELAREFVAITKIHEERPELGGDAVARREVMARLSETRANLEQAFQHVFDTAEWYRRDVAPCRFSYRELNGVASDIAAERFNASPRLANELLNRSEPSSNAVSAQKALLRRMVLFEGQIRLGIEGFPAEGGLFDSIIDVAGIYKETVRGWRFVVPDLSDPCCLRPAFDCAEAFLEKHAGRSVSLSEIYDLWKAPPFGIRSGLLPVLAVAYVLARRDRLAFYREGIFQARFTDLDVDYLTNDPKTLQVRWMDISEVGRSLLSGMADIVRRFDKGNRLVHLEPIDVARGLVAIYEHLRPWVKRTARLSSNAIQIRNLFKQAVDPNKFIFDDIPSVLGSVNAVVEPEALVGRVQEGLEELTEAYPAMLARLQHTMLAELHVPNSSSQALRDLRDRAENIRNLSGDFQLNAFVGRLSQFTGQERDLEGIASLMTNKPPRDWVDADLDQATLRVAQLAQEFIRSEAFARVKGRPDKRQAMSIVVGVDGRPTPVSGEFDVTPADRGEIDVIIARLEQALEAADQDRKNLILAALAEVSARHLTSNSRPAPRKARVG